MPIRFLSLLGYTTFILCLNATECLAIQTSTANNSSELNNSLSGNSDDEEATFILGQNILLETPLSSFSGHITIEGGEHQYAIDGNNKTGFSIGRNRSLNLNNLILKNFFNPSEAGALRNNGGQIDYITHTLFQNNYGNRGGALSNEARSNINQISATFRDNRAQQYGAAINNLGEIGTIRGIFENNTVLASESTASGGAIANSKMIKLITDSTFANNKAIGSNIVYGGAINNSANKASIDEISNTTFRNNSVLSSGNYAYGGAIYNSLSSSSMAAAINNIINSNFIDNHAISSGDTQEAYGGAIATNNHLTISADKGSSLFSGNYTLDKVKGLTSNAIYMLGANKDLNLIAQNKGTINFEDGIDGLNYDINISGDTSGSVIFNNKIQNARNITLNGGTTLNIGQNGTIDGSNLSLNQGTLNLENGKFQNLQLNNFSSSQEAGLKFDADLSTGQSDRISAQSISPGSKIKLEKMNILNDGNQDIILFSNGLAPEFSNLDSFAAFTSTHRYTFTSNTAGILHSTATASNGLNGVSNDNSLTKSYTLADSGNVNGDLGNLIGGATSQLSILGNNKILDGEGYKGTIASQQQTLNLQEISSVENFKSTDGGFIKNSGKLNILNTSFKNNSASHNGGAIWSEADINIGANNKHEVEFTGNTANGLSNAIYMANSSATLNLIASNESSITFNDGISGIQGYGLNINGDGKIFLNQKVDNVGNVNIKGSQVYVKEDSFLNDSDIILSGGELHFNNSQMFDEINLKSLTGNGGTLHIDADTFKGTADTLKIENLYGTVKIIVHNFLSSPHLFRSLNEENKEEKTGFEFAEITRENKGNFDILRVEGSALEWEAKATTFEDGTASWIMDVRDSYGRKSLVTAETISYLGLNNAALQQTDSLLHNLNNQNYSNQFAGISSYHSWMTPVYSSVHQSNPVDFEAKISGLDFGGDVQPDAYNRYGTFFSYRQGHYDFNGDSNLYYSDTKSKIDINSYLAGLYYRYQRSNLWAMGSLFGGLQKANLKTDDGVSTNTSGIQYGMNISSGYLIEYKQDFNLEPSMSLSYNRISFDDINDDYGKTASFENASQIEIEAGLKVEKTLNIKDVETKVSFKPSIVQTFVSGDDVHITSLNNVNTMKDRTLGRTTIGLSTSLNEQLKTYGTASYTFGNGYQDTAFNLGLNYAF